MSTTASTLGSEDRLRVYCHQRGIGYVEPCWGETTEQRAARVAALSRRLTPRQRRRLARKARAR